MARIGEPVPGLPTSRVASLAACASLALGLFAAIASAQGGDEAPSPTEAFRHALHAIDDGKDQDAAVLLEQAALDGDERAQYLLGAIHFTSKSLPANKPLGFAWLQLAASDTGPYDEWSSRQAVDMMAKVEPLMNGRDLVEADRLAESLRERVAIQRTVAIRSALDLYTREPARLVGSHLEFSEQGVQIRVITEPSRNPLARPGCGSVHGAHCPDASMTGASTRCSGLIHPADDLSPGKRTELVAKMNPNIGSRGEVRGSQLTEPPLLLVHVDADGWVCSAVLAVSSGDDAVDDYAIDEIRSWRASPATQGGSPIESLYVVRIATYVIPFNRYAQ